MKYLLLSLLVLITSCKQGNKSEIPGADNPITTITQKEIHPGKIILENECYICHDPRASEESMIAPPMAMVKKYYISERTTQEEFTEALMNWINDPEQHSKIPEALERFGIMPYIPYPENDIVQIADYLYQNDIEKPDWLDVNYQLQQRPSDSLSENPEQYGKIAAAYAKAAKEELGKHLIKAISEKGPSGAVAFCQSRATKLTDSVSLMNNAIIKRVSDQPRNPSNKANAREIGYINYYKQLMATGIPPKPIVQSEKGEVSFYAPIVTNSMCLQCHGKPGEQISSETLETLMRLYPTDSATGYTQNEVRGLWAISFEVKDFE